MSDKNKCYVVVEILWNELGFETIVEAYLDKKLAEKSVKDFNKNISFKASGEAEWSEEHNCSISRAIREVKLSN